MHDAWLIRLAAEGASSVAESATGSGLPGLSAWPNPFRTSTTFRYAAPGGPDAKLYIHDASGRVVNVVAGSAGRGMWDGRGSRGERVGAGVFFCRVDGVRGVVRVVRGE